MLSREERHSFVDALRPPFNYRLHSAIGTGFSLDFFTLTAILLAFLDAEMEEGGASENITHSVNIIHSLQAMTRLANRVRIYVNRGYIHHKQEKSNKIYALYGRMIKEVKIPGGNFHPKVWALRYEPKDLPDMQDAKPIYRLICQSRNITNSNNWELAACLEGKPGNKSYPIGEQAKSLLETIIQKSETSPEKIPQNIQTLLQTLPRINFELPSVMRDSCEFHWQFGASTPLFEQLPEKGRHALILSPFLGKNFIKRILERFNKLTLISSVQAMNGIFQESVEDPEFRTALAKHKLYVLLTDFEDGIPGLDLHAKFYMFATGDKNICFMGSANATQNAWSGPNCEALMTFSPGISIEKFYSEFIVQENGENYAWITEYTEEDWKNQDPDTIAQQDLEKLVGRIRDAVAQIKFTASYSQKNSEMCIRTNTPLKENLKGYLALDNISVAICPLTLLERANDQTGTTALVPLAGVFTSTGILFKDVRVAALTEFLYCNIQARGEAEAHLEFVLKADIDFEGLLDTRDTQIIKEMVNKENFHDFLNFIIFDGVRASLPAVGIPGSKQPGSSGQQQSLLGTTVTIEDALKSCTEDHSRIEEVNHLLDIFKDTDCVDPDFRSFWKEFSDAFKQVCGKDGANG